MRKIFFLFIPFLLSAEDLSTCYQKGDIQCGFKLAEQYKATDIEKSKEIYLDLSQKGQGSASLELGKLFIYQNASPLKEDCRKGVAYFLNSLQSQTPDIQGFLEISKLFEQGICLEKNQQKADKYKNSYIKLKGK